MARLDGYTRSIGWQGFLRILANLVGRNNDTRLAKSGCRGRNIEAEAGLDRVDGFP